MTLTFGLFELTICSLVALALRNVYTNRGFLHLFALKLEVLTDKQINGRTGKHVMGSIKNGRIIR